MSADNLQGHSRCVCGKILVIAVVIMAIIGDMVWTEQRVGAALAIIADDARRLDMLERLGSPAVAEIRSLQMQALLSAEQRRIDALEVLHNSLSKRLEAAIRSSDAMRIQVDRHD
jgi:hypothetical protein